MRPGLLLVFATLAGGCINLDGMWSSDGPVAPPPTPYLALAAASPAVGSQLSPAGHVSFTFDYGIGSSGAGSVHDIGLEIAAPPGASYTIPRPCVEGLTAMSGGRASCDAALAGDWAQAAHPMAFSFILIKRDPGSAGVRYVGQVVATIGPFTYGN